MQRKNFIHTVLAVAAAALLPVAAHAQAVKLTLGHGAAVGNPRHDAAVKFAEVLKAKSGGRIEVQVAPSGQLGDDAAMVTALRLATRATTPPSSSPRWSRPSPLAASRCRSHRRGSSATTRQW